MIFDHWLFLLLPGNARALYMTSHQIQISSWRMAHQTAYNCRWKNCSETYFIFNEFFKKHQV